MQVIHGQIFRIFCRMCPLKLLRTCCQMRCIRGSATCPQWLSKWLQLSSSTSLSSNFRKAVWTRLRMCRCRYLGCQWRCHWCQTDEFCCSCRPVVAQVTCRTCLKCPFSHHSGRYVVSTDSGDMSKQNIRGLFAFSSVLCQSLCRVPGNTRSNDSYWRQRATSIQARWRHNTNCIKAIRFYAIWFPQVAHGTIRFWLLNLGRPPGWHICHYEDDWARRDAGQDWF